MIKYDYLIIGGGIAGTTAAEVIKEKDSSGSLAIVDSDPYPLYSKVLLSSYLRNKIGFEKLFLRKESDYKDKKIDIFFGEEVVKVDAQNKKVFLKSGSEIFYNKLLLASGGTPKKTINLEGVDNSEILYFRTLDDAKKIKEKMKDAKRVIVIGGSFISLELAELFFANNISVSIILRSDQFFRGTLDKESSEIIRKNLEEKGISVLLNKEIGKIDTKNADIIAAGVGLERNIDFLAGSGIKTEKGILANEYLETGVSDIWTAGDVAEYFDVDTGKHRIEGNWLAAFLQGKIAGSNMTGGKDIFKHLSGYNLVNFGLNISFIGDTMVDVGTMVVIRGDIGKNERAQLFLRNDVLVGATQINASKERGILAMIIDRKVDLSSHLKDLEEPNFDLKKLL